MTDFEAPWRGVYPPGVDWSMDLPVESVPAALDRAVANYPDRPCIDFLGKLYSYAQVGGLVDRAAKGFQSLGVAKGTRVGLLLPNSPAFVISYYGILKAGGTVVNFNPLYAEEEIRNQIEDSGVSVMITLDLKMLLPKVVAALGHTALDTIVVCTMAKDLPFGKSVLFRLAKRGQIAAIPKDTRFVSFAKLLENDGRYEAPPIDPARDIAVLQYTGGTTGVPKGAMLTHANLAANRAQVTRWTPELRMGQEVVLGVLPLFHVFAMTVVMNLAIEAAACMILLPRFDLTQVLKTIHTKKPTLFPGVPTIFTAINNFAHTDKYDLSSLEVCISGGAPLPVEVKAAFEGRTGCTVVEGYGLSESSPVVTCNPLVGANKPGSIGLPLPGTTIEVHDLESPERRMPQGTKGEICVRGPQVMAGYWNRPEETAEVLRNGLLRTGDVGYLDEEGYVYLVDRLKDVILCKGYNVYPRNIEEAIYAHGAVAEVTVIGIPDPLRGQSPKAFVRLKEGESLTEDELRVFLGPKISPVEIPREIEFRDELPKTMIGKLSKKELVAEEMERANRREAS